MAKAPSKKKSSEKKPDSKKEAPAKKHNINEIAEYLKLKFEFRRNELSMDIEIKGDTDETFMPLDDPQFSKIFIELQINGFKCGEGLLKHIMIGLLAESYNPLKEYFMDLPEWDGHDYIADLAATIKIADIGINDIRLTSLWPEYLKRWLIAAAGTAISFQYDKGRLTTNHLCIVLTGGQGVGKSSWLNRLCPLEMKSFLYSGHIHPSLTESSTANLIAEKWFINIDDQLETIFGKEFNSMKSIITSDSVSNRKAWARFAPRRPRIASFMASVNSTKFLTDTQNRRYLVFTCDHINFQHTIDMNKVWAQAHALLVRGDRYWLIDKEITQLNQVNDIFRQVTPEEEWLMKYYAPAAPEDSKARFVMASDILHKIKVHSQLNLSIKKLSQALEHQGFGEPISKRIGNQKIPRKVYSVIELDDKDEADVQNVISKDFERKTEKIEA